MSNLKVKGIIIKQSDFGEANRILTIFTSEYGIIKAAVYGAKSIKNKNSASSQFLCYADFILKETGRDIMTFVSCDIIDSFFNIQEDITKLSLCVYFSDLIYSLINQNAPDEAILRLFLNTVYALCYKDYDTEMIRAVFELRIMAYAGYRPNLNYCSVCSKSEGITAFCAQSGGILCNNCAKRGDIPIDSGVYHAIKYILSCDEKKMFSFEASKDVLKTVSKISESYVTTYIEKSLSSLEYYKKMIMI